MDYVDALKMDKAVDAAEGSALRQGYDYYMTERAGAETYPNYSHMPSSFMPEGTMLADAISYALPSSAFMGVSITPSYGFLSSLL